MDWLIVAVIAGLALLAGQAWGWRAGRDHERADAAIRRRLDGLGKPWDGQTW